MNNNNELESFISQETTKRIVNFFVGVGVTGLVMKSLQPVCPPNNNVQRLFYFYGKAAIASAMSKMVVSSINKNIEASYYTK